LRENWRFSYRAKYARLRTLHGVGCPSRAIAPLHFTRSVGATAGTGCPTGMSKNLSLQCFQQERRYDTISTRLESSAAGWSFSCPRIFATDCNRLVVVDGIADHGVSITPFQLLPNARLCRDRCGEGAARPDMVELPEPHTRRSFHDDAMALKRGGGSFSIGESRLSRPSRPSRLSRMSCLFSQVHGHIIPFLSPREPTVWGKICKFVTYNQRDRRNSLSRQLCLPI